MRGVLFILAVTLALQDQGPPPGNPEHIQPPEGWHCYANSPVAPAPDGHACVCHEYRTCTVDPETGQYVITEHPSCRVWCFKDHCRCPVHCDSE